MSHSGLAGNDIASTVCMKQRSRNWIILQTDIFSRRMFKHYQCQVVCAFVLMEGCWWSIAEISVTPNCQINARELRRKELRTERSLPRTDSPRTNSWHTYKPRLLASDMGSKCNLFWLTTAKTVSFVGSMLHVYQACEIKIAQGV